MEMNELDAALDELGMLSTITNSRKVYLNEMHPRKSLINLVEMNTRYVRSVSIGLRMKSIPTHFRVKPYVVPRQREERIRTRSENADIESNKNLVASVIDAVVNAATDEVQTSIKKSKSLENVHLEQKNEVQTQPEVELVSTCIQKLKMAE